MLALLKLAALGLLLTSTQLHAQGMSMPMDKPAVTAAAVPFVKAEVRKVDEVKGTVILNHEEIPNLSMSSMTMAFDVADKKMLKGLKTGDKVRFQADSVKGKLMVVKLERSK